MNEWTNEWSTSMIMSKSNFNCTVLFSGRGVKKVWVWNWFFFSFVWHGQAPNTHTLINQLKIVWSHLYLNRPVCFSCKRKIWLAGWLTVCRTGEHVTPISFAANNKSEPRHMIYLCAGRVKYKMSQVRCWIESEFGTIKVCVRFPLSFKMSFSRFGLDGCYILKLFFSFFLRLSFIVFCCCCIHARVCSFVCVSAEGNGLV